MLTVDFDRLGVGSGTKVIDVGCGAGRHTFEAFRRGADVIGFDKNAADLNDVDEILQAMKLPAICRGRALQPTVTLGAAVFDRDGSTVDALRQNALGRAEPMPPKALLASRSGPGRRLGRARVSPRPERSRSSAVRTWERAPS